eukprot:TRINITY_DN2908_c0_g3_i4.p1 TRINITY_DN2908_c0_g3~~TRINITY_DN2908_c0_g3_i4.p1  ORF type:complete len:179 (-),score=21.75 TRINITY_DN2908_c0_g3_i4:35-571(-)
MLAKLLSQMPMQQRLLLLELRQQRIQLQSKFDIECQRLEDHYEEEVKRLEQRYRGCGSCFQLGLQLVWHNQQLQSSSLALANIPPPPLKRADLIRKALKDIQRDFDQSKREMLWRHEMEAGALVSYHLQLLKLHKLPLPSSSHSETRNKFDLNIDESIIPRLTVRFEFQFPSPNFDDD